jgi:hypothetical protein
MNYIKKIINFNIINKLLIIAKLFIFTCNECELMLRKNDIFINEINFIPYISMGI